MRRNRLLIAAVVVTMIGCGDRKEPDRHPARAASFDPRDPVATVEWLIDSSAAVQAAGREASIEQANNPLRKEKYNAYLPIKERWDQVVASISGRRIEWPARVHRITEQDIELKAELSRPSVDGHEIRVHFETYPVGKESYQIDGKIPIGKGISLEHATKLNTGDVVRVSGIIDKFGDPFAGYQIGRPAIWFSVRNTKILPE